MMIPRSNWVQALISFRETIVRRIVFLKSPLFDIKDMVDPAMKAQQLPLTGKTPQDQLPLRRGNR